MPDSPLHDLCIVGGGVNGTGIARDAAGRGLSVILLEGDDLAAHTSSASTKLIHGGLRYLEYYEFRLVRKALREREVLLAAAPHIMWPLRFIMPHDPAMRPVWMIRLGLYLYDHLARRRFLPASKVVRLASHPAGAALDARFVDGFEYSDGWVDDARLVVLNAVDAQARGATIRTRARVVAARRSAGEWQVDVENARAEIETVRARALVNAAGPWVASLLSGTLGVASRHRIRLIKGSHIVVPKLFDHPFAYIFQNPDGRIIFAIPYEDEFTLIGTTDIEIHGDPAASAISAAEVEYLCTMANRYLKGRVAPADVVHTYCGVRPLLEDDAADPAAVTRDYWLELNTGQAPVLSVFGGKITTFRKLAEEALDLLLPVLGGAHARAPDWTEHAPLPGGDLAGHDFDSFLAALRQRHPWLPASLARRYAHAYGTRVEHILRGVRDLAGLGEPVARDLYPAELEYLCREEWAVTADDVLWRRTKLGLHLNAAERAAVGAWLEARNAQPAPLLSEQPG